MINYINPLLADMFFSSSFVCQKKYQQKMGGTIKSGLMFNLLASLVSTVAFLVICKFAPDFSVYSLLTALVQAVLCATYTVISFYILKRNSLSMYTLFLMTGGMIVPYVWGIFVLNEQISVLRVLGLLIITVSIVFTSHNKNIKFSCLILCIIVFFVNGLTSVVAKLHQTQKVYATVAEFDLLFWTGAVNFLVTLVICLFMKGKEERNQKLTGASFAVFAALLSGCASYFNLKGATSLPATVLYPMVTGGTIVLSFVFESIVFKEKITLKKFLPVAICFAGTCMFV